MQGKNIVIIGASSGVGKALAEYIGLQGAHITSISRTEPDLPSTLDLNHHTHDVLSGEIPVEYFPETIDGLVYCPGSINLKPFRSLSEDAFKEDFEINVVGAIRSLKPALKKMKRAEDKPSVVLFSTVAVQQGMAFHASVASAKGAIEGLTRSLAAELSPKIRVNCIAPSLVDTPLASKILSTPERIEASNKRHPLQRIGTPKDIAQTAAFLLDDSSSWMTGQVLGVDGGMSTLR